MALKFAQVDYSRSNNEINRLPYSIYWVPVMTVLNYFKNYENIYFLLLSIFQLLTLGVIPSEWSPTGPFSTAIPLALCVIIEIITAVIKWYTTWSQDTAENNKTFQHIDRSKTIHQIHNRDLYPGHIIYLGKNDISSVDGILLDVVNDDYGKINLALLTGESNIHHISKPDKCLGLYDYIDSRLYPDSNIDIQSRRIAITKNNFIPAGAIIKSEGVYIWVTACGSDKVNKISFPTGHTHTKYSRIDKFLGEYMMRISVALLVSMVFVISSIKTIYSGSINIYTFVLYCLQNWVLFNGVIPFSAKIFVLLARSIEAYACPHDTITINDPLQIDDFGKIKKIICDKTGTVTKNELEFTKFIAVNTDSIIDVARFSSQRQHLPKKMYQCLGLCIHQTENDFATIEDKIIRAGYQALGGCCSENEKEIILNYNDCDSTYQYVDTIGLDFTFDRKMSSKIVKCCKGYYIYCKGSPDVLFTKVTNAGELRRTENIICQKYPELRLLALAYRKLTEDEAVMLCTTDKHHLCEHDLKFLGIIGIKDILQPEVMDTVNTLAGFGVTCSLCTGDRRITAVAVAEEVNIVQEGSMVEYHSDLDPSTIKKRTLIFSGELTRNCSNHFIDCLIVCENFIGYNMTPIDKKTVVSLLESHGINTLAIGDGLNDLGMFDLSSISVAIKGNSFVENYTDFSTKQFSGLKKLFELSIESYHKNSSLINYIFYRCCTVTFAIMIYCLINFRKLYESPPFNGFVLQAFNFGWTIVGVAALIYQPNSKVAAKDYDIAKNLDHTCYRHTSVWNVLGILNGIALIYICYYYQIHKTNQFNDILALIVIYMLNVKLLSISKLNVTSLFACLMGIINFGLYLIFMQCLWCVFKELMALPVSFFYVIGAYTVLVLI